MITSFFILAGLAVAGNSPVTPVHTAKVSYAENQIIQHESGGNVAARSRTSTAMGLGQLTVANRVKYAPRCKTTPKTQIKDDQLCMMRAYIADAYGSAEVAWATWQRKGWY